MPLVTYRLGTISFSRALMSFGCHSMCFMHLGGLLSGFSPPNSLGFSLVHDKGHLTGYPLRYVGGFNNPLLRKVTSEGRNTNDVLCFLPLVLGFEKTFYVCMERNMVGLLP